ncbi:MAG: phosphonate C-P lyase system protein PhnL [Pseudomonadota bacterium]
MSANAIAANNTIRLSVESLHKHFQLHLQNKTRLPVLSDFSLQVSEAECVALVGRSGMGKSTLLKCLYGNYVLSEGRINVHFDDGIIDIANTSTQNIYYLRQHIIGYVSQFLRVIPRVPAIAIVMEPLLIRGIAQQQALAKAQDLLHRLNIPESLWSLSPTTFSGGEQQRINIARGFIAPNPILFLDEPTASLDAVNRKVVIELINEAKHDRSAIVGIFHDEEVRDAVADKLIYLSESAA